MHWITYPQHRNEAHFLIFTSNPRNVSSAYVPAMELWLRIRIGATVHDMRNAFPELLLDFTQARQTALIFNRVVKERGDGHLFVSAVFNHDRRHSQQMANVRSFRSLANLFGVQARRITQRRDKAFGKDGGF